VEVFSEDFSWGLGFRDLSKPLLVCFGVKLETQRSMLGLPTQHKIPSLKTLETLEVYYNLVSQAPTRCQAAQAATAGKSRQQLACFLPSTPKRAITAHWRSL
jgi:hypothetical protein